MRLRMGVGGNARPIGLIGRPVDEAGVMLWDEDRPFGAWQLADLPFAAPGRIERDLTPGFSVNIGARVNRVCQHMINSGIVSLPRRADDQRLDDADLADRGDDALVACRLLEAVRARG